jgi:hypothetical protein
MFVGVTGQATVVSSTVTLTTSWQRFQITGTPGATAKQLFAFFTFAPVGTAGADDFYEVTGVQLEVGSIATAFTNAGGTIQGELAACQRYYYRTTPGLNYSQFGAAMAGTTTAAVLMNRFPVTMRVRPTALEQSGTAANYAVLFGTTITTCSAVPTYSTGTNENDFTVNLTVASGLTAGQAGRAITDSPGAGAYLGWSAEL